MIQVKDLYVELNHQPILREISLALEPGLHYIVGLNGSGKTTFLRSLAGLLSYSGSIQVDSQEVSSLPALHLARQVAFVQQRLDIPFRIPVYDFLLTGRFPYLNWLGSYSSTDHKIAGEVIHTLSLENFISRSLNEISGGELQKVMIARALVQKTPILLLDEPAQSLDPKNKAFLFSFLRARALTGQTIVCTTHDLEPLEDESVFVTGFKSGEVVYSGAGGDIRDQLMAVVYD
ncbi:MAG: ABC transporter ATP-binding protein [Bacteroidia bacterium]